MQRGRSVLRYALALAWISWAVAPVGATTLIRQGLDHLVAANATIVLGEVLDIHSYWNDQRTFILTDVRIAPHEILKGDAREKEITITVMGGTVGDLTTLILGGVELVPGREYLLFLNEEELPGAKARTVRDHCQGAFDILPAKDGPRAVSQAHSQALLPDAQGENKAPGGVEGIRLDSLKQTIRTLVRNAPGARQEVK